MEPILDMDVDTLKAGQKSSFDLLSSKDNFNALKDYKLSLQWRNSDGTDQYVDKAPIYKVNGSNNRRLIFVSLHTIDIE